MNKIEKCSLLLDQVRESRETIEANMEILKVEPYWVERLDKYRRLEKRIERRIITMREKMEEIELNQPHCNYTEHSLHCMCCQELIWLAVEENDSMTQINTSDSICCFLLDHEGHKLIVKKSVQISCELERVNE